MARTKLNVEIDSDLMERARNTVYWLSGPPLLLRLTALVEQGIEHAVSELERVQNNGRPFYPRNGALKKGPPNEPE